MDNRAFVGIILAAGNSTRMKSDTPKVLHTLLERPMLEYVIDALRKSGPERILVVVGFGGEMVINTFNDSQVEFVTQRERLGTAHAVLQTAPYLDGFMGDCIILCGDTPLISASTLRMVRNAHIKEQAQLTILTAHLDDPTGYGRILRDHNKRVVGIVEEKDATEAQRGITEINTGVYCFKCSSLFELLKRVEKNNIQAEYYLTDCVSLAAQANLRIADCVLDDSEQIIGVNSRAELARATDLLRMRKLNTHE